MVFKAGDEKIKTKRIHQKPILPKYDHRICDKVMGLCLLGYSDQELADIYLVPLEKFKEWIRDNPALSQAISAGREDADAAVAASLLKRATGFEHDEIELKVVSLGGNQGSEVQKIEVTKYYAPDVSAQQFWLKMRQKKRWSDNNGLGGADPAASALAAQAAILAALATAAGPAEEDK